jgi:hypothetical protein
VKSILSCRLLLVLLVVSTIGCKSVVESQVPPSDSQASKIVLEDKPFLVDSAMLVSVQSPESLLHHYTYQWSIDDSVFPSVQSVDSIFLTIHEPGLHRISVEVSDVTAASSVSIERTVLVSMPAVSAKKLSLLRSVLLRFTGVLIQKNYTARNDTIPDYSIDSSGIEITIPIILTDAGSYYGENSTSSTQESPHFITSVSSSTEVRFKLGDSGRVLSQFEAQYAILHGSNYPGRNDQSSKTVTINQMSLITVHKDTLVYRLSGEKLKETIVTLRTYGDEENSYPETTYFRYTSDSIDWDNSRHPPSLSVFIF